jgi:hypothetical protein
MRKHLKRCLNIFLSVTMLAKSCCCNRMLHEYSYGTECGQIITDCTQPPAMSVEYKFSRTTEEKNINIEIFYAETWTRNIAVPQHHDVRSYNACSHNWHCILNGGYGETAGFLFEKAMVSCDLSTRTLFQSVINKMRFQKLHSEQRLHSEPPKICRWSPLCRTF